MENVEQNQLIEQFGAMMEKDRKESKRRYQRNQKIFIVFFGVLSLYLGWMYVQVGKINPEGVSNMAYGYIEDNLPAIQEQFSKILLTNAPEIADQGKNIVLLLPAVLREYIEGTLPTGSQLVASDLEDLLNDSLDESIDILLALKETEGLSDDPIELIASIRLGYKESLKDIISSQNLFYQQYTAALTDLKVKLDRLAKGRSLSSREKQEREIIAATLVLLDRFGVVMEW